MKLLEKHLIATLMLNLINMINCYQLIMTTRFWIKVYNTNIDYPVVQGKDNAYYLNHDFNKNYLSSGSIFMDYRNDFENDKSIVIYGHHMKNKTMFGELTKFKQELF